MNFAGAFAVLIALGTSAAGVRADEMDKALLAKGDELMDLLKKHGWQNVGVLKFELQRGGKKGPIEPQRGRLNGVMATRLENVLILSDDTEKPIGIVCGAGDLAATRDAKATYQTAEGRRALFAHTYPLAWGKEKVKVHAFLTGLVQLSPDMKSATVFIKAFEQKDPEKVIELMKFETKTTLALLSDMDLDFIAQRTIATDKKPKETVKPEPPKNEDELIRFALDSVPEGTKLGEPSTTPNVSKPDPKKVIDPKEVADPKRSLLESEVLEFGVYYNDKLVPRIGNQISPPDIKKQVIHIGLKSKERIGVVLRVNGVNTADGDAEVKDANLYARWVLEPNKPYAVYGWYREGKERDFEAVEMKQVQENPALVIASKLGKIELDVFREGAIKLAQRKLPCLSEPANGDGGPAPATLAALQAKVEKTQARALKGPPVTSRHPIVPGEAKQKELATTNFQGYHIGHLTITYFTPVPTPEKPGPAGSK
jgi:hypothetical protein